jgi:hypothetical protein
MWTPAAIVLCNWHGTAVQQVAWLQTSPASLYYFGQCCHLEGEVVEAAFVLWAAAVAEQRVELLLIFLGVRVISHNKQNSRRRTCVYFYLSPAQPCTCSVCVQPVRTDFLLEAVFSQGLLCYLQVLWQWLWFCALRSTLKYCLIQGPSCLRVT